MSGAKQKRQPPCVKRCGRLAAQGRGGKCMTCYFQGYHAGERLEHREDLGPDKGRLSFYVRRETLEAFHEKVPPRQREQALRGMLDGFLANERSGT